MRILLPQCSSTTHYNCTFISAYSLSKLMNEALTEVPINMPQGLDESSVLPEMYFSFYPQSVNEGTLMKTYWTSQYPDVKCPIAYNRPHFETQTNCECCQHSTIRYPFHRPQMKMHSSTLPMTLEETTEMLFSMQCLKC